SWGRGFCAEGSAVRGFGGFEPGSPLRSLHYMGARDFKDLGVWQLSMELLQLVIEITDREPARSDRDYCHQVRKAARSVSSNLAANGSNITQSSSQLTVQRTSPPRTPEPPAPNLPPPPPPPIPEPAGSGFRSVFPFTAPP